MKTTFFDEFLNITNELDVKLENFEKLEQEFVGIKKEYSLNNIFFKYYNLKFSNHFPLHQVKFAQ